MPKVRYERIGAAAVLTIDRRERRNAVDAETAELLLDGFSEFEADDGARVLVLTGAGPEAFCAGADLKAIAEAGADLTARADRDPWPSGPRARWGSPGSPPRSRRSRRSPAGASPAGSSWRSGAICGSPPRRARLGYPERRWGVPLIDGGTQRLPLIVGMGRALELILTGRIVEAAEALDWGLVNEVVCRRRHLERALELAEGLAAFPQATMLSDRRAAIEGTGLPLGDGLELEAELGRASIEAGIRGAARFAAGEGRGARGRGRLDARAC